MKVYILMMFCTKISHTFNLLLNTPQGALGCPGGTSGKEPTCQCRRHKRHGFDPWVRKTPWRRAWQPTPVLLPGEFHGQRSLVGCELWGHKELDMTEVTQHTGTSLLYLWPSWNRNLFLSHLTFLFLPSSLSFSLFLNILGRNYWLRN